MQTGIIEFHGKALLTAKDIESGRVYVAMRPIVEGMGLSWGSQFDRINKDKRFDIKTVDFTGKDNKPRKMMSLATEHLAGWLYSINPNKVRKDLRETIIAYQKETFNAINDYWNKGSASRVEVNVPTMDINMQVFHSIQASLDMFAKSMHTALTGVISQNKAILKLLDEKDTPTNKDGRPAHYNTYLTAAETEEIVALYKEGYNQSYICKKVQRSDYAIRKVLREAGLYKPQMTLFVQEEEA